MEQKKLQVNLPKALYEEFFRKFPGKGERKVLIERFVAVAIDLAKRKDDFVESVVAEARERYGE